MSRWASSLGLSVRGGRASGTFDGRDVELWQSFEEIRVYTYLALGHRGQATALAAELDRIPSMYEKTATLLSRTAQADEALFGEHIAEVTLIDDQRVLCRARYVHDLLAVQRLLQALSRTCNRIEAITQ